LESLVQVVASEIARYSTAHPDARDTAEGISWWVQMQRQEDIRNSVPEAIALLLSQGILERSLAPDGAQLYGFRASTMK
jgi:hypothetical protein